MTLPIFNLVDRNASMLQTQWAKQLNPLTTNISLQSIILKEVELHIGLNTINHLLGRVLTGWRVIRKRSSADIYDVQDNNPRPNLTLLLITDSAVSIDIEVF